MSSTAQILSQKSLTVIFAYAPTGLGHLRVTKALYEGLPPSVHTMLLGSHDQVIASIHRFASLHPLTRTIMEMSQRGIVEDVTTYAFRSFLRSNTTLIYEQITTILDQLINVPKTILIIATHTSLAHQISAIKEKLSQEKKVNVFLVVQVTDDTPQHIWYVPGADLIFVPSERVKNQLAQYARAFGLPSVPLKVNPYPVSPNLSQQLSSQEHQARHMQVERSSRSLMYIALPISGAAVGTTFFQDSILALQTLSPRFRFQVIAKRAPYTEKFLNKMLTLPYVHLTVAEHDRQVVEGYEDVYKSHIIAAEITKPSEQAFKALLKPRQRGGSLLLFSSPVGQQEYDNLFFLRRHNLIPTETEQVLLFKFARENAAASSSNAAKLFKESFHWRGIQIPYQAVPAAHFIWWALNSGLLANMMHWKKTVRNDNGHAHELTSDGVKLFWQKVADFLKQQK